MNIFIVGYKHLQGESKKTGKPYDFYELYVVCDGDNYTVGQRTMSLTVNPTSIQGILPAMIPDIGLPATVNWGYNPVTGKGFVNSVVLG